MSTNIVIKFIITDSKKFLLCSSLLAKHEKDVLTYVFNTSNVFLSFIISYIFQILLLFVTDLIKVCFPFLSSIPMTVRSPKYFVNVPLV